VINLSFLIGRVGKTSIINKFFNDKFNEKEEMTINSCYAQKEMTINGKKFVFCIWVKSFIKHQF
jgi:GTPase SAR1 family protein